MSKKKPSRSENCGLGPWQEHGAMGHATRTKSLKGHISRNACRRKGRRRNWDDGKNED